MAKKTKVTPTTNTAVSVVSINLKKDSYHNKQQTTRKPALTIRKRA